MALPFIAGLAVGAGAALLFTKREQIKEKLSSGEFSQSIQNGLSKSVDRGKEISSNALKYAKTSFTNALNAESKTEELHRAQKTQNTKPKGTQRTMRKNTKAKDNQ
ncbi:hypothetical protein [Helicobacter turcicus]|uniref:YtxH domain-containing protein n=1 Tax=Helicobacter turcicus TaxID=2867412 RepID=A0ABS7JPT8_9HELI|nr:hypothetical protein [Helicobacter turcicus]MBX7491418.1 hypothetical protein [Helicobacter turcicus]MBX7546285.1 hypothetical protein [Helicobacter turcicus]